MDLSLSELWVSVMDREAWRAGIHGVSKSWTRLSNWTELKVLQIFIETFKFHFFDISGWVIAFDYCDIELFSLQMNQDHSVIFEIAPKYCAKLVDMMEFQLK